MSSVALRGLTKRFGSQTVLDNVTLTIPQDQLAKGLDILVAALRA